MNDDMVTYARYVLQENESPDWKNETRTLENVAKTLYLTTDRMEDSKAKVFTDFANKHIHIGRLIPSHTQEEILFSCAPECFPVMLFTETLRSNEIVIIENLHRYSDYKGYLYSFEFTGFYKDPVTPFDTLVIDSVDHAHFRPAAITRDLNKAYLGFKHCSGRIVTGNWGCGAFGGDTTLKFLQQLCAAEVVGAELDYSAFGNPTLQSQLQKILKLCVPSLSPSSLSINESKSVSSTPPPPLPPLPLKQIVSYMFEFPGNAPFFPWLVLRIQKDQQKVISNSKTNGVKTSSEKDSMSDV